MADRIATGEVHIDLNDGEVLAGLRAVDSEFDRTMSKIERQRAVAEIDAKIGPLADKVEQAKRRLKTLQGQKAEARIGAKTEELDRKIVNAERAIKRLDGRKATLEVKLKGHEKVLAAEAAMEAAEAQRARAAEQAARRIQRAHAQEAAQDRKLAAERLSRVNAEARTVAALERQRTNELRASEREAYRMETERQRFQREATVGVEEHIVRVTELQLQYKKLSDRMENLSKKRPLGSEARIKAELDATGLAAKMEAIKYELQFLGNHPPIEFEPKVSRKGLRRVSGAFGDLFANIGRKAASLSDLTVRIGPFTTSLKALGVALAFLGPSIIDLLGGASALIGTLGAGISGAATLGAGAVTGMAGAFLGLKFSMRDTGQEVKQARTSINALQSAQLKYGKNSDKAKAKQEELNNVMRQISPLARETAKGVEKFFDGWDRSTKGAQKSLGEIAKDGFTALNQLRPMWAGETNKVAASLQKGLSSAFDFLGEGEGKDLLSGIFKDFNAEIPTMLSGLGKFGVAFLRIAREGMRSFDVLTGGVDSLGDKLMAFTEREDFGDVISSWVDQARDLMRFFGAAGRVMMHFFGAGSEAGQGFVKDMTAALNRWDKFLTSSSGRNSIADAMERAVNGVESLWDAIAPIAGAFVQWASALSPVVTGFLKGVGYAGQLFGWLAKIAGMGGPLTALGVTLGSMWALGKAAAFVSFLERAWTLVKSIRTIGLAGALANIGSVFKGGGIATAGATAAAEMRAGIISGGAAAAAEIRAAMMTGGLAAAAEGAGGAALVGGAGAAAAGGGVAAAEAGGAAAAGGTLAKLASFAPKLLKFGAVTTVVAGLFSLIKNDQSGDDFIETVNRMGTAAKRFKDETKDLTGTQRVLADSVNDSRNAHRRAEHAMEEVRKLEAKGETGTRAYRAAVQEANAAMRQSAHADDIKAKANAQAIELTNKLKDTRNDETQGMRAQIKEYEASIKRQKDMGASGEALKGMYLHLADLRADLAEAEGKSIGRQDAMTLATLNNTRALRGFMPMARGAAKAYGDLARKLGAGNAMKISTQFALPGDAAAVGRRANAALNAGVSKKIVMDIIVNSKGADDAIRKLNAKTIEKKRVEIIGDASHALAQIAKTRSQKIQDKVARILGNANDAIRKHQQARALKDIQKVMTILGVNGSAREAYRLVQQFPAITIDVYFAAKRIGNWPDGGASSGTGGNASGTRPVPVGYNSLVGEGGGPEWIYNAKKQRAMKVTGPSLLRLQPDDAVVPTEPKYAGRGRQILDEIAQDMGLNVYKKGKKPTKTTPYTKKNAPKITGDKTVGVPGNIKALKKLGVPDPYSVGAVPVDLVDKAASEAISAYTQRENKIRTASDARIKALYAYKHFEDKDKKDKKGNETKAWKGVKNRLVSTQDLYDTLVKGGFIAGKGTGTGYIKSEKQLKSDRDFAAEHKADVHRFADRVSILGTKIETDRTIMETAAAEYERTGGKSGGTKYTDARKRRVNNISALVDMLDKSSKAIARLKKRFPHMKGLNELEAGTKSELAGAKGLSEDMKDKEAYPDTLAAAPIETMEDWLKKAGQEGVLDQRLYDVSKARINNVPDDPGTPEREDIAALSDDSTSAKALMDFYKEQYDFAVKYGASNPILTEFADAFVGARDEYNAIQEQITGPAGERGPSQVDLMDTARADLYREFGGNTSPNVGGLSGPAGAAGGGMQANTSMMDSATGPAASVSLVRDTARASAALTSGGGAAAPSTAGAPSAAAPSKTVNNNVTNNFQAPPPDPHTWSQGVSFELGALV